MLSPSTRNLRPPAIRPETQPRTGSDRVVARIIERVHLGELPPGHRLPSEEQMCEEFGASRTVVREALQQLKAMGVVRSRSGSGTFITEGCLNHLSQSLALYSSRAGDVADWTELLEIRSLIETECARRLAREGTPATLAPAWEALETMRRSVGDLKDFGAADVRFHRAIVEASGNRLFATVHQALGPMTLRFTFSTYRTLAQTAAKFAEHEAIFQAILGHREDEAAELMRDHLAGSARNMLEMFAKGARPAPVA
jgi:GntR family transcriptional regulator, transcriptional repressor for pyruvate dehydrogenase complex